MPAHFLFTPDMQRLHTLFVSCLVLLLATAVGCTDPLYRAAKKGDSQRVRALLDQGERASLNRTLVVAACQGHTEIVQLLLQRGANVNRAVDEDLTQLQCAAFHGRAEMVSLLLQAGAKRNTRNSAGKTARDLAGAQGYPGIVKLLDDAQAASTATRQPSAAPGASSVGSPPALAN